METSYRIAPGKIAHQNIDGEVIVIHFDSGNYYSLNGSAAALWQLLAKPRSLKGLCSRFAKSDGRQEALVEQFLEILSGEGLLERLSGGGEPPRARALLSFEPPIVEKYSDMQHLLLADPLHDVEEAGWPNLKS